MRQKPGFSSFGVDVGVSAEEGLIGCSLIPPRLQFRIGILEETADISADESHA